MKKYNLMKSGEKILRILEVQEDKVLVIDCVRRTMPTWVDPAALESYAECADSEFTADSDDLSPEQRKVMQERYTMIAPVLSIVGDEWKRSAAIGTIAENHCVSKQTVRKYLCQYLSAMDITALAPKSRSSKSPLTQDEKNMRWALNKFFYTIL